MAELTQRIRFTVPKAVKDHWKAQADQRGISLSALLHDAVDGLIAAENQTRV